MLMLILTSDILCKHFSLIIYFVFLWHLFVFIGRINFGVCWSFLMQDVDIGALLQAKRRTTSTNYKIQNQTCSSLTPNGRATLQKWICCSKLKNPRNLASSWSILYAHPHSHNSSDGLATPTLVRCRKGKASDWLHIIDACWCFAAL